MSLTKTLPNMNKNQTTTDYFPITDDAYPSMDVQMKSGQLRTKI